MYPGGCCTLMVEEEISPDNVEHFECLETQKKHYINVDGRKRIRFAFIILQKRNVLLLL